MTMTFDSAKDVDSVVHFLNYWIMIYDIEGNLVKWKRLTKEFELCPTDSKYNIFRQFGTDFKNSCDLDMTDFLDTSQYTTYFYEIALEDTGTNDFYIIPIKIN